MSTIFAQATAKGRSGVAIVRLSGPQAFSIAAEICGGAISPRQPVLRNLRTGDGIVLDQSLVLGFAAGASFTGEEVVEFQCHGSPAVIDGLCLELSRFENTRLAEPGEFTRRALENGCLDLSQVEGLSDLLEAETEAQRSQAFRIMQGSLSNKVEGWRTDLIRAAALIEATIDFADEDVPVDVSPEVRALMTGVMQELRAEVAGSFVAERIRDGFEVAIVGAPNVGKSTLLNTLAGRDAAITSEIAGTTRDVIEVRMDLNGLAVTLLDTAGLRKTSDAVENLGIERALRRAAAADLRVFLTDASGNTPEGLDPEGDDIVLYGKSDLQQTPDNKGISGLTGQGVDALVKQVTKILSNRSALALSAVRQRHRVAMEKAVAAMSSAEMILLQGMDGAEIAAMELNGAIAALNSLIGRVGVEDLLDEIFASFCLGK